MLIWGQDTRWDSKVIGVITSHKNFAHELGWQKVAQALVQNKTLTKTFMDMCTLTYPSPHLPPSPHLLIKSEEDEG